MLQDREKMLLVTVQLSLSFHGKMTGLDNEVLDSDPHLIKAACLAAAGRA